MQSLSQTEESKALISLMSISLDLVYNSREFLSPFTWVLSSRTSRLSTCSLDFDFTFSTSNWSPFTASHKNSNSFLFSNLKLIWLNFVYSKPSLSFILTLSVNTFCSWLINSNFYQRSTICFCKSFWLSSKISIDFSIGIQILVF